MITYRPILALLAVGLTLLTGGVNAANDQSTGVAAPEKSPISWVRAVNTRPGRDAPDLLERLRDGFAMPDLDNELVRKYQNYYMKNPGAMRRLLENGRRYAYYVLEELERRGMPSELALLPMVESSYNPKALSPARAAGLWQFIPSTGRNYGLSQSWWEDNRRDVVSSTGAALDYLSYLYSLMGDWHLALASYNWGEGAVGRSVAKNQQQGLPTGYDDIRMPAETKNYVPRLQAIKNILRDPQLVAQMGLPVLPNRPYFESVALYGKHIDIDTVAKLANISVDEVKALNPEHYRPVLKVETINLPKDRVTQFKANLNSYQETEKPLSRWASYTVQPGEKPERIADKFKMSISQLQEANGVSLKSLGKPGQPLLVLTEGGELPKGAAPIAEMGDNTPVSVPEDDKPPRSAGGKSDQGVKSSAKDSGKNNEAKTGKPGKPNKDTKNDRGIAKGKAEKSSAAERSAKSSKEPGATKPSARSSDKAASPKVASSKSGSKSDNKTVSKDKAKR
ncbi:MAG: LysM peptidoglycan-binding domain-containing protein [Rhodocyclaceae bacterium]|nr:LysM peptidoglycan-binding domain-containing protein [Rhodocyclaceae bacterium]